MLRKTQLVWKVNGVILVVLVCVLGILNLVSNDVYERDALESARDVSRVNARTILESIRELMMRRDTAGIGDLFHRLTLDNPVYRDIRLVSHGGQVVAAGPESSRVPLDPVSWPCTGCHASPETMSSSTIHSYDEVVEFDSGERAVSVVTPIYMEGRCDTSGCHVQPAASPVLGLLQADFSLRRADTLIAQRNRHTMIALLVALMLITVSTWWMIDRLVGRRIRILREGAEKVAQKDFSFRFRDSRGDGIARLSATFDNMVSELSSTISELKRTKDYMQGIVESSADIIITVDPSGLIKTFNMGAERILGYTQDEMIGTPIEILFAEPAERDEAIARLAHTDHVVNYETHFVSKSGEIRDVILTLSRLRDPDGTPIGTFGISKDVTVEKKLQHELILKEKLAAIGQAVAGIHHSLKNMLGSLKGGSYMVNTGIDGDDRALMREGWAMVQDGIRHITDLSSRMLQYVRDWAPDLEDTDLCATTISAHQVSQSAARERGIEFRADVPQFLPMVRCDPQLIHSAVMDLVWNALDACAWKEYDEMESPDVVLRARCADDGRHVELEVQDNGQGMTEEIMKDIFNPFFTTKSRIGTGMGLTLTSRIIHQHGGAIEVESEPNHGSMFRISLPINGPRDLKEDLNVQESPTHR